MAHSPLTHRHHDHHQSTDSQATPVFALWLVLCWSARDVVTSARRRRERQLRAWHRHVRTTVATEPALHHSAQRVEAGTEASTPGSGRVSRRSPSRWGGQARTSAWLPQCLSLWCRPLAGDEGVDGTTRRRRGERWRSARRSATRRSSKLLLRRSARVSCSSAA